MSVRKVRETTLLKDQTAVTATTGLGEDVWHTNRTYEVSGHTSAGAGATDVVIEVRNSELAAWKTLATVSLVLGTTEVSDGFASQAAWRFVRARITAISGTDATVSANVGSSTL